MRIAVVNDHYATASPGGQHRIQNLGLGFLKLGHDVLFVSPEGVMNYEELPPTRRGRRSTLVSAAVTNWLQTWSLLKPEIPDLDLVIVELPMPATKGFSLLLARLNDVRSVLDFGDIWFGTTTHSELLRMSQDVLYRGLCRLADVITVPTKAMASFLQTFANVSAAKIPFPVDTKDLFNPELYRENPISGKLRDWHDGREIVVYSGTLSEEKGCGLIPHMAKRICQSHRGLDIGFLLIGDGPYREWVMRECEGLGIRDRFQFLKVDNVKDIPRLIAMASVAIALTPEVGLPFAPRNINKIVEYLAMGKPVISMEDSNSWEYLEHGTTGLLSGSEGFHSSILNLLAQPRLLKKMSNAARDRAVSAFDCKIVASKLLAIADLA